MLKSATEAFRSWVRRSSVTLHVRTCQAVYLCRWNMKTGPRGRFLMGWTSLGFSGIRLDVCEDFSREPFCVAREQKKRNWVCTCVYVTSADVCWSKWFHLEQMNNLSCACKEKKAGRWGEGGGELMGNKVVQHSRTVENKFVLTAGEEKHWFFQWPHYKFMQRNTFLLQHFDWALLLCC